jgi:hypothetical protein
LHAIPEAEKDLGDLHFEDKSGRSRRPTAIGGYDFRSTLPAADGVFNIQLPESVQQATVILSDLSGKVVFEGQNIQNRSEMRVAGLPAGVYTIRIIDADDTRRQFFTKKLVLGR